MCKTATREFSCRFFCVGGHNDSRLRTGKDELRRSSGNKCPVLDSFHKKMADNKRQIIYFISYTLNKELMYQLNQKKSLGISLVRRQEKHYSTITNKKPKSRDTSRKQADNLN